MLDIDTAIKHCFEVVENNEQFASGKWIGSEGEANRQECEQCAADHRQLAEWLTELKELREENKVLMQECDRLIKEKGALLKQHEQIAEYKRLLKLAVEDIYNARRGINCRICDMPKNDIEVEKRCEVDNAQPECKYRWKYETEALKLIES